MGQKKPKEFRLGVLVSRAVKVEECVERLKRNALAITEETRAKANVRLRPTWTNVREALNGPRAKPIIRRIEPLPNKFEHDAKALLDKAEFRTRVALTGIIERTIVALEKVKRKLDQNPSRLGCAA
ncbi:MAG: hypothetical protein ABSA50_10535 [Candidatus Bathyarchaeia archaeon]